jgi:hypothetical protein
MRPKLLLTCLVCTIVTIAFAHPGTGIVKDSKGFIYYTDLTNIYRIDPATLDKIIVVRNIHTHELFMDRNDNLYGEHLWFKDEGTNRFDHYLWRLNSNGKLDTVSGPSRAYTPGFDFSVCRDNNGNEYRVQALTTDHILKKTKDGRVTTIASGSFKDLAWLQPFDDGSVYYTQNNSLFRITGKDSMERVVENISNSGRPDPEIYGIWRGPAPGAIYVAVADEGTVKKISSDGRISGIFSEEETYWFPTGGVFDNEDRLWVLEYSKGNHVRVVMPKLQPTANTPLQEDLKKLFFAPPYGWIILMALLLVFLLFRIRKKYER